MAVAEIAGAGNAAILLCPDEFDARVSPGSGHGHSGGVIGRAIIDDDELPILKGLCAHAGDGQADEGGGLVGGHHNGNFWRGHGPLSGRKRRAYAHNRDNKAFMAAREF